MTLNDVGWSHYQCASAESSAPVEPMLDPDQNIARIVRVDRGILTGVNAQGPVKILDQRDALENTAVGDFCTLTRPHDGPKGKRYVIGQILDRRSSLTRLAAGTKTQKQVLAANVDTALIFSSANQDFNLARTQRYVITAHAGGVKPLLVLSKIDLSPKWPNMLSELNGHFPDLDVIPISAATGDGLDELKSTLVPGETYVLLGSSGVGKSSAINALCLKELLKTGDIRQGDDKGKHTTTHRSMHVLPDGAILIDSPGLRELAIVADQDAVDATFPEIDELTAQCKYSDCQHDNEPNCAVLDAIQTGVICQDDLDSYRKLQRAAQHAEARVDKSLASLEKKKWKSIHKSMKSLKVRKPR